jgi:hypothetical protein
MNQALYAHMNNERKKKNGMSHQCPAPYFVYSLVSRHLGFFCLLSIMSKLHVFKSNFKGTLKIFFAVTVFEHSLRV